MNENAKLAAGSGPKPTASSNQFQVLVDDNFHYQDESERYTHGQYPTLNEAIAEAKKIVDRFLQRGYKPGMTAEALYKDYQSFGDDPFIRAPDIPPGTTRFSAWDYAKERCEEICAEPAPPADKPRQEASRRLPAHAPEGKAWRGWLWIGIFLMIVTRIVWVWLRR